MMRMMTPGVCLGALALAGCQNEVDLFGQADLEGFGERPDLSPPVQVDRVQQTVEPKVDILWVIDNSGSMQDEQDKLANNFPAFMEYFLDAGLDWHIGVTTTDATATGLGGALRAVGPRRYLTPDVPEPVTQFAQLARVGVSGSADELGLCAAWRALAQPSPELQRANSGFLREEAALHVIVVSDEADSSYSYEESPCQGSSVAEFINFMNTLKPDPETPVSFSAIAGPPPRGCLTEPGNPLSGAGAGRPYDVAVEEVGQKDEDGNPPGAFYSICEDDWQPILDDIGLTATQGLRKEVFLTDVPVPDSLQVLITTPGDLVLEGIAEWTLPAGYDQDDLDAACDDLGAVGCVVFRWNAQRNSVVLPSYVPPTGSTIEVSYTLRGGAESGDAFSFGEE